MQTGTNERFHFLKSSIYREQKQCSRAQRSFLTSSTSFYGWIMWWSMGYNHHQPHSFEVFEVWGFFWEVYRVGSFLFCLLGVSGFGTVLWSTTSFCSDLSVCRAVSHIFSLTTAAQCFYGFLNMLYQRCHHLCVVTACSRWPHPASSATAIPHQGHTAAPSAGTWASVVHEF